MNYHPDYDLMVQTERRKAEMAAAEQHRLANLAVEGNIQQHVLLVVFSRLAVMVAHGMAWLGDLLMAWSCRLESRYALKAIGAAAEGQPNPCTS